MAKDTQKAINQQAANSTTDSGEPVGVQKQGAAMAGDVDDRSREGTQARDPNANPSEQDNSPADDAQDDRALAAQDRLDLGRPPTAEEIERADAQARKEHAVQAQEAADAALRQGIAGIGAEFQPPAGQKPVFISRGQHVNPDGKRATRRNLMLETYDEDED